MLTELNTHEQIQTAVDKLSFFDTHTLRPQQLQALEFIAQSSKRFIAIEAPTGTGKSAIGAIAGLMTDNAIYTVHSKSLQEQIQSEFPEIPVLMGRANYMCGYNDGLNAGQCTPSKAHPCTPKTCDYARTKAKCKAAPIKCLNYPYLFAELNYAGAQFGNHDVVVCDEADTVEEGLSGFISLRVTSKMIKEYGLTLPKYKAADGEHKLSEWKDWAKSCAIKLAGIQRELKARDHGGVVPDSAQEEMDKTASVLMGFDLFQRNVDSTWLYDEDKRRYGTTHTWKPLWLTRELAERFLWSYNKRWILMSATLPPPETLCRQLGIPIAELDYLRVPSPFNPKRSPVYLTKSWDGRRKTEEYPERFDIDNAVKDVQTILAKHVNVKGLIHCVSYKVVDAIMAGCQREMLVSVGHNRKYPETFKRLVTHKTANRTDVLSNFISSPYPQVLVSPSMDRGVSLPYEKCRFSILVKTPFESLGDKKVSKRLYDYAMDGNGWYKAVTAQNIVQAVGRGMRAEDDWCVNYLIDSSTYTFVFEHPGLFNEHFRACIVLGANGAWKEKTIITGMNV